MGKHSAVNESTTHPLVADALARRPVSPAAAHADDADARSGSTGWPEPAPSGGGAVGWPDDTRPEDGQAAPGGTTHREAADVVAPAVTEPRRGWWRLFGARPAA
ncbi:hypothetical protein [Blastococcus sp. SYSU DS0617]